MLPLQNTGEILASNTHSTLAVCGSSAINRLSITRLDIIRLPHQVADKNGEVMSDRLLAYLGAALNWYASRSNSYASPIVRGMARTSTKTRASQRVLNDDELRAVCAATEHGDGFIAW
jgi:hypothetical protein